MKQADIYRVLVAIFLANVPSAHSAGTPEDIFWEAVQRSDSADEYRLYLEQYPNGVYSAQAKKKLNENEKPQPLITPPPTTTPTNTSHGIVARVNGVAITQSRANALIENQVKEGKVRTPELESAVKEELVRREILAQAAISMGIDKRSDVQAQLDLAHQGVMIGAYLNEYARNIKVSDVEVKKEYDVINSTVGKAEYKARHILVESVGEAKSIIAKLKGGAKFADLAKASKDPGSKDRGGELGWANKASYVPPFAEAMVNLTKGKFTEVPVQTQFGWHVIQLDDVRGLKAPTFEEVKPQIIQRMRQKEVEKHILEVRRKSVVE